MGITARYFLFFFLFFSLPLQIVEYLIVVVSLVYLILENVLNDGMMWWWFLFLCVRKSCLLLSLRVHMTMQHRLDRVLSLTTSLVTPLNLVMAGVGSACIRSFVDADKKDISMADGPRLLRANDEPVLLMLAFVVAVVILGVVINEPFSDTALLRDCARCFFKLANVVPACD